MRLKFLWVLMAGAMLCSVTPAIAQNAAQAVLWVNPGEIRSRDLFWGPGGKDGQPQAPFEFVEEKPKGNSPKFEVRDGSGEKWTVKMGAEARPEPVASRLLWAVGYFANTNYYVNELHVEGLPRPLARGEEFVNKAGDVMHVRLQRKLGKHEKPWSWRNNPFKGTREFNGLRVMMALLHNWDLKDVNNSVFTDEKTGRVIYYVSDVGASFGTTGMSYTNGMSKDNLHAFRSKKFISKVTPKYVDFNFPTHPPLIHIFALPSFIARMRIRWIGRKIPRADVRWIASLLSQLSEAQIEDAFRAGGYPPEQAKAFTAVLRERIAQLARL